MADTPVASSAVQPVIMKIGKYVPHDKILQLGILYFGHTDASLKITHLGPIEKCYEVRKLLCSISFCVMQD